MTLTTFRIVTLHYLLVFNNRDMKVSDFTSLNHMHSGNSWYPRSADVDVIFVLYKSKITAVASCYSRL